MSQPNISMRVPEDQLAAIDAKAADARMSRTQYMIRTALGEPISTLRIEDRLQSIDERIARLEEFTFG